MPAMTHKNAAAVALGRKGGRATAENRTAEERREAARKAVEARWAKAKKDLDSTLDRLEELNQRNRSRKARKGER
jgi:hypothetical protein